MINQKLLNILVELGLNEHEAKVYLAAVSLGSATILNISKAAEIKRTTVYSIIESLKQKGLMNIVQKGFKKQYSALSPERLEIMIENRREEFKKNLPELLSLYNFKENESMIKYYEGLNGIKNIYEELIKDIKPSDYYLVISDTQKWKGIDEPYFNKFMERRFKKGIKAQMIFQDTEGALKQIGKFPNEEIKILPPDIKFNVSLTITPRKLLFFQITHPIMAMVIENKNIIEMHKELFEIIWKSIKD
jgi:sugar-specific transcriptional regulator TrmB